MFDVNRLLDEAIKETEYLNDGEVFLVKDLYKGYLWNRTGKFTYKIAKSVQFICNPHLDRI